jgi:hypothetical protein
MLTKGKLLMLVPFGAGNCASQLLQPAPAAAQHARTTALLPLAAREREVVLIKLSHDAHPRLIGRFECASLMAQSPLAPLQGWQGEYHEGTEAARVWRWRAHARQAEL